MNWRIRSLCACLALTGPVACAWAGGAVRLSVGERLGELPRYGVNLGGRSVWGADQLMANVVRNPGFETIQDGALLIVGRVQDRSVVDDSPWTARPDGFWAGAHYEVLSGPSAGQSGRVMDDRRTTSQGPVAFWLEPMPLGLQPGDVVALEGEQDPSPAPLWWTQGHVRSAVGETRPGSTGSQSVRLLAVPGQPASLFHHLDSIGARAGKLLPVQGRWQLSVWVRSLSKSATVRLTFARQGSKPWMDQTVKPSATWQQIVLEVDALDEGPVGPLQLAIQVTAGEVLVDDLYLGEAQAGAGGFRSAVVQTLEALRPGYLREWQGQLADTPANRMADAFRRKPVRYRPGAHESQFMYALPEFMALCDKVKARPWVILPATSTPRQARAFGALLAELWRQYRFDEIVVEYGNEHWNTVFRPAGIGSVRMMSEVADRLYAALRDGAGPATPLHWVLGTQYVNPAMSRDMVQRSQSAHGAAVAPYFLYRLNRSQTPQDGLDQALHEDVLPLMAARDALRAKGRSLDVYEVNFHTTLGDAPIELRNAVVDSPAAGVALARRLMQASQAGVARQAVYSLAGYDSFVDGPDRALVHLWGITRDLGQPAQWRPTGLAQSLLNEVAAGGAARAACAGDACEELTAMSFQGGKAWAAVSAAAYPVRMTWGCQGPQRVKWLDGSRVLKLNEQPGKVVTTVQLLPCVQQQASVMVPARSLVVMQSVR